MAINTEIKTFFDRASCTYTHLVIDPQTRKAAIIDSVLNYDPKAGRTASYSADEVISYVQKNQLEVEWILETHVHADHLSAASYLKAQLGGKTGIGSHINSVQKVFKEIFNAEHDFPTDGSQFDVQFEDDGTFTIGELTVQVLHTPGHTPACVTYLVDGEHAFVGDTIFMPDGGTARCDFPGGSAEILFRSVKRLLSLPESTKLYMCHDYGPNGREYQYLTTVKDERERNIHVNDDISVAQFIDMRTKRDETLQMPVLILPSVQINMRAGELPPAEDNGTSYIKIPINRV